MHRTVGDGWNCVPIDTNKDLKYICPFQFPPEDTVFTSAIMMTDTESELLDPGTFYHKPQKWFIVGMKKVMGIYLEVNSPKIFLDDDGAVLVR